MSAITTHVLDTARGRPAAGIQVRLEIREGEGWRVLAGDVTDADGRAGGGFKPGHVPGAGVYRLSFATGAWFKTQDIATFYPEVRIIFEVADATKHHHVPLLLSPFGYSTYRGS